ncbi:unnamed protein product [Notodromas monacha]|uniref:Lipid scramblase CLPTM1L n=1 Tax=Notodromas monacha TaxID=399045 RepID=A0A7R9G998_9CRUS|nr:unnamed protein product [Notodromas monacha]CAG0914076.1 unnamed protein product [Notodromas monacha]
MQPPSLTTAATVAFVAYFMYSMWGLAKMFWPPECPASEKCMKSCLNEEPDYQVAFVTSVYENLNIQRRDIRLLDHWASFDYSQPFEKELNITLPEATRKNGTMFLHIFFVPVQKSDKNLGQESVDGVLRKASRPNTAYLSYPLILHREPDPEAFQLLGSEKKPDKKPSAEVVQPVSHFKPTLTFNVVTEKFLLPVVGLPQDVAVMISYPRSDPLSIPPLLSVDFSGDRLASQVRVNTSMLTHPFTLKYAPISFGKFRVWRQFELSLITLKGFGFGAKDVDEVKSIFEMNPTLLFVTMFVSVCHLVFDFLAFKNDVEFWRGRRNIVGVSTRALIWRAFSQAVVFVYLWSEESSLLIWIPSGIAAVIELWKLTKAFKIELNLRSFSVKFGVRSSDEEKSSKMDKMGMTYLGYLLAPLVVGYSIYSLLYTPHKSWGSWVMQVLVGFVYGFGFLFMFPQLFLNYQLKSVAHLPWRAFTYKAFNTFIDDLFAFVITMPTLHRVACFRDDVVFLIYLYQRW